MGVYLISGNLAASGAAFFAVVAGVAVMGYHVTLYLFAWLVRDSAGFSSWATAALVPSAVATSVLALISYPWMDRLERWLNPERHEGLSWR